MGCVLWVGCLVSVGGVWWAFGVFGERLRCLVSFWGVWWAFGVFGERLGCLVSVGGVKWAFGVFGERWLWVGFWWAMVVSRVFGERWLGWVFGERWLGWVFSFSFWRAVSDVNGLERLNYCKVLSARGVVGWRLCFSSFESLILFC